MSDKGVRLTRLMTHLNAVESVLDDKGDVERGDIRQLLEEAGLLLYLSDILAESLDASLPDIPDPNALCHRGICRQSECVYCSKIIKGYNALAQYKA